MSKREYSSFADFRKDLRGSAHWSNHIDEIADQVGNFDEDGKKPHKHALFDNFEDFENDDA